MPFPALQCLSPPASDNGRTAGRAPYLPALPAASHAILPGRARGRRRHAGLGPGRGGLEGAARGGPSRQHHRECAHLRAQGRDDVEEYVYPLQYSGRTDVEALANFRKIHGALGFGVISG